MRRFSRLYDQCPYHHYKAIQGLIVGSLVGVVSLRRQVTYFRLLSQPTQAATTKPGSPHVEDTVDGVGGVDRILYLHESIDQRPKLLKEEIQWGIGSLRE